MNNTRSETIHFSNDVRHARLIAKESCKMNGLREIIFWEGLDLGAMPLSALTRSKCQRAVSRTTKFSVRLES